MELKSIIRRLTPVETCRLMGFNGDDYLDVDGPLTKDSPKYKACGNSWGVNSAEWVNWRIERVMRELGYVANGRAVQYATTCSGVEAHSQAVKDCAWNANFFSEIEKFPCRVLAWRYPHVPNLGDMTKVDGTKYDLDVFSGGTPCFTAGAMVLTKDGYKPIEDIKVGDMVVTHKNRLCRVSRIGSKKSRDIVDASIVGHGVIRSTHGHPYLVAKPHRHKNGKMYFDRAEFSPIGDATGMYAMGIDRRTTGLCMLAAASIPSVYKFNEIDLIELCGWYLGDGYIRRFKGKNKKCVVLCLNDKKLSRFEKRFGKKLNYSVSGKDAPSCKVQIACTDLADFLVDNFGELSHCKRIPYWVYLLGDFLVEQFLVGYYSTDGHKYHGGHGFTTTSPSVAYGVADLFGKASVSLNRVSPTTVIEGRVVNQRNWYRIACSGNSNHFHRTEDGIAVRVKKVEPVCGEHVVYNIEVEEDHSYVVNGLFVHNCQDYSVAGRRAGGMEGSGTRSSLAFHWIRIGKEANAKVMLWENVPGALSSNGGRDFSWFVYRLAEAGFAVAWRVLDVQHTFTMNFPRAIPQRRRRIWLVASADGDWRTPARILFERSSRLGDKRPTRVLNDGTVVDDPNEGAPVCDDLFSWAENKPHFTRESKADMIPLDLLPAQFGGGAANWLGYCGDVRYYGPFFTNESEAASPDILDGKLLKAIGAGAGVAFGNRIVSFKTKEWTSGIQMPWGATGSDIPREYNGTVCGLSDILLPWGDYLGKYLLSKRACEGIVRRAEKRGKELPPVLKDALKEQIGNWDAGALDKYLKKEGLVEKDEVEEEEDGDGGEEE